ncbi:MAG: hypothetical protein V1874_02775 [Spirochaetota bacterium]
MKNTIKRSIFALIALLSVCMVSCRDSGNRGDTGADTNNPVPITLSNDYTGTLTLEYSRDFPGFSTAVEIDVDVYKSGDVLLSQPDQATYDATEEEPGQVKIREYGSVTVTSLSGLAVETGGEKYIQISANTLITGVQTVWGWTGSDWYQVMNTPFDIENPIESPMNFNLDDAVWSGASIGKSIPAYGGTQTFKWTLLLSVVP